MPPCEGGYKEFKIGDLFESSTGDTDIQKQHITGRGDIVISSGAANNGIIGRSDISARIFSSNTLTIDMFGNVHYHDCQYKMVTHARVFSLKARNFELSKELGIYFITALKHLKEVYSFDYMCSWEKIKNDFILVPVKSFSNEPIIENVDFEYIISIVHSIEQECLSQIFAKNERTLDCYLKAANAADTTLTNEEKKAIDQIENMRTTFSTITVEKIFSVKGNPQLNKENFIFAENAEYPYFTRTVKNNGFLGYVKYLDEAHKIDGKVLAVGMLGMQFFYVDHDYYSGQFTKSIRPKDFELDEALALWFISWFNQSSNYYKSLLVRDFEKAFNNTKITLPIDADGKIDFALMRMYISAIKKIVIQEVRERMAKEYAAYHQVIGETEK